MKYRRTPRHLNFLGGNYQEKKKNAEVHNRDYVADKKAEEERAKLRAMGIEIGPKRKRKPRSYHPAIVAACSVMALSHGPQPRKRKW